MKLVTRMVRSGRLLIPLFLLAACTDLLPRAQHETSTPWNDYGGAQAMFDQIKPGTTTLVELRKLGIDPAHTPNVASLAYADVLRRFNVMPGMDLGQLDGGLSECVQDNQHCFAFEMQQSRLNRKRIGNFWLDILNFKREIEISGWQFNAIIVIRGETVAYKLWSGNPNIRQSENERNPLGPLQGIGASLIGR